MALVCKAIQRDRRRRMRQRDVDLGTAVGFRASFVGHMQSPFGITRINPVSMAKAWDEPGSTPGVDAANNVSAQVLPAAEFRRPDGSSP